MEHGLQNTHTFHWTFYINILTSVRNIETFYGWFFIRRIWLCLCMCVRLFMICNRKIKIHLTRSYNRLYWLNRSRLHLYVSDRSEIHCSFPFLVFLFLFTSKINLCFSYKNIRCLNSNNVKTNLDTLELCVCVCVCFFFYFLVITHKS